jgi:hypothetical protein
MTRKRTYDLTIERAVVASALSNREFFVELAAIIKKADMFYSYAHRCCWLAFYRMHREGLPFDPPTLYDTLVKDGTLDDVKAGYIAELHDAAGALNPVHLAKTVVDLHVRRQIMASLEKLTKDAHDGNMDPWEFLTDAKRDLETISAEIESSHRRDEYDQIQAAGFRPFPIECLPACVQEFVQSGAEALGCDPVFIAIPALVAIGAAIGNSRYIQLKETWREPSVFWAAVVADSGTMKSPSLDLAISPLWSLQQKMSDKFAWEWERYRDELQEWNDKRYAKNRKSGPSEDDKRPEKPIPKKVVVCDITIEKLAHVMHENSHGVCLCMDELGGWFSSFGRYSEGKGVGADMSQWLSLHGARRLSVDRKTGDPPSITVRRASCSVVGTIQPSILQRTLSTEFFESGLTSRLLLAMPPRTKKVWTENVVPEPVYTAYANAIQEIYDTGEDILAMEGNEPRKVPFSPAGKKAWIEFYEEWAKRQDAAEGEYVYALAKLEGYCARFCLLMAVTDKHEWPGKNEMVTANHVFKAFKLVEWFAYETERVYSRLRTPADEQLRDRLIDVIRRFGGVITAAELRKTNPKRYLQVEDAVKALDGLAAKGLGNWGIKPPTAKGGKPARVFQILLPLTETPITTVN